MELLYRVYWEHYLGEMNFLAFDSAPLQDFFEHLKSNSKNPGNAWIISLYGYFPCETIHQNDVAINLQGEISIYSLEKVCLWKLELIFLDI